MTQRDAASARARALRRLLLGVAALALLAVLAIAVFHEEIVLAALDPGANFDAAAVPRPPDFENPAAWSALPERDDAADRAPAGLTRVDPRSAPADVFYVHPTSYVGPRWNGPVDDEALNGDTDELATLIQASAFNGCCAIYAPRYRQANGRAFIVPDANGDAALDLAYRDVAAAFRFYRERHGADRPFVLAAHSQGSAIAARLLRDEIASTGLRHQLVVAYLIGGPITVESELGFPVCEDAAQTGCVVAWNARGPGHEENVFDFRAAGERLCVNPLTWRHDQLPAPASENAGAVFLHAGDGNILEGFASAECRDGTLVVSLSGPAPRDFMSRLLDVVVGRENFHPIEFQLFYVDLRRNAQLRVDAFLAAASSGD